MAAALCSSPGAALLPVAQPRACPLNSTARAAGQHALGAARERCTGGVRRAVRHSRNAQRRHGPRCCASPSSAAPAGAAGAGDVVSVRLVLSLTETGEVLHSSPVEEPLTFEVGAGSFMASPLFKDLDKVVQGLQVGQKQKFQSRPMERTDDLVFEVPRAHEEMQRIEAEEGAKGQRLEPGLVVQLSNGSPAVILQVLPELVVLDTNHPLAGKEVTFEVELMSLDKQ